MNNTEEKIVFNCVAHRPDVERLSVHLYRTPIPPRTHSGFALAVVTKGLKRLNHMGIMHEVPAGSLTLLNPDELHAIEPDNQQGVIYQALHVPTSAMMDVAPQGFVFPTPVLHNASIARRFAEQLIVLDATRNNALWNERLSDILYHASALFSSRNNRPVSHEDHRISLVRTYIEEHINENLEIETLSALIDLSKFHFIRLFKENVGATPHAYIQARRTARAKLMLQTRPPIQVASLCGFVDQSHLTRWIKACYGTTPSAYHKRFRAAGRGIAEPMAASG
ncbi:helix-turn-helix domain-containing protein [Rhizobium helianthi]|uniref:Helix-turn-helix domain-containing protein n=1 Tax=Rhizobium helianthi TaxID=1132695 RepID=A0ABW4M547_9HYPH